MRSSTGADLLADSLIRSGVRRHDRVVIFLDTYIDSVVSLYGILQRAGGHYILGEKLRDRQELNQAALSTPGATRRSKRTWRSRRSSSARGNAVIGLRLFLFLVDISKPV